MHRTHRPAGAGKGPGGEKASTFATIFISERGINASPCYRDLGLFGGENDGTRGFYFETTSKAEEIFVALCSIPYRMYFTIKKLGVACLVGVPTPQTPKLTTF